MKFRILCFTVFYWTSSNLLGQNNLLKNFSFETAPFFEFKKAAIVFTFDDGSLSQFNIGAKILEQFNFKGTFFITTDLIGEQDWKRLEKMIIFGHEIGSHTISHPNLCNISLIEAQNEILGSKLIIESNLSNYKCSSFSYPYGLYNSNILKYVEEIYDCARTVKEGYNNSENLKSFCLFSTYFFSSSSNIETANKWVNGVLHSNRILIESFHGFDGNGHQPISSILFRKHLQFIKSKESLLWITTLSNLSKYLKERQNLSIEVLDSSKFSYCFRFNDNLNDTVFNQSLTFKMKIPNSWKDVHVIQNSHNIKFQVQVDQNGNQYIIFDAIPNNSILTILSQTPSYLEQEQCESCNLLLYPNPFNNEISVLWNPLYLGDFSIIDLNGKIVEKGVLKFGKQTILTDSLKKGSYLFFITLKTENGNICQIKRVVKE